MSRRSKPLGIVVYKGTSLIDKKNPVIVVATGVWTRTENPKIGDMIQFWILRRDIPPLLAARIGEDYSICGECKHRHFGSCYVNFAHGPQNVFNAFHRDRYVDFNPSMLEDFAGKSLRMGAYGDPAAVPYEVWDMFCRVAKNHTGYTHQWKLCDTRLRKFLMASVDDQQEKEQAKTMGWRTFRIRLSENDSKGSDEFTCPASHEGGKKTSCGACGACGGLRSGPFNSNPCIIAHGGGAQSYKVKRFIDGMRKKRNKKKFKKDFSKFLIDAQL